MGRRTQLVISDSGNSRAMFCLPRNGFHLRGGVSGNGQAREITNPRLTRYQGIRLPLQPKPGANLILISSHNLKFLQRNPKDLGERQGTDHPSFVRCGNSLRHRSPTFLAPGTGFGRKMFFHGPWEGEWFSVCNLAPVHA